MGHLGVSVCVLVHAIVPWVCVCVCLEACSIHLPAACSEPPVVCTGKYARCIDVAKSRVFAGLGGLDSLSKSS